LENTGILFSFLFLWGTEHNITSPFLPPFFKGGSNRTEHLFSLKKSLTYRTEHKKEAGLSYPQPLYPRKKLSETGRFSPITHPFYYPHLASLKIIRGISHIASSLSPGFFSVLNQNNRKNPKVLGGLNFTGR